MVASHLTKCFIIVLVATQGAHIFTNSPLGSGIQKITYLALFSNSIPAIGLKVKACENTCSL
jgi:hypothetical protein